MRVVIVVKRCCENIDHVLHPWKFFLHHHWQGCIKYFDQDKKLNAMLSEHDFILFKLLTCWKNLHYTHLEERELVTWHVLDIPGREVDFMIPTS